MSHRMCVLAVAGRVDDELARRADLLASIRRDDVTVFRIDHHYSRYWARIHDGKAALDVPPGLPAAFPTESVLRRLAREMAGRDEPCFAILMIDLPMPDGGQWAVAFSGERRLTCPGASVNAALAAIGVRASEDADECDTIGLGGLRADSEHLGWYSAHVDEEPGPTDLAAAELAFDRISFERRPGGRGDVFRVLVGGEPVPMTLTKVLTHTGNMGTRTGRTAGPRTAAWIPFDGPAAELTPSDSPYSPYARNPVRRTIEFRLSFPRTEIYNTVIWRSVTLRLAFDAAFSAVDVLWHEYSDDST